ncbi:MAG TPA: TerC family protein [Actinomycetota bacterium]|nr:TerC family protein [Actinomycetota bacterium]
MDFFTADIIVGFLTLLALEIVLGIDNIVFLSILAGKLPVHQQKKARQIGLGLALLMRVVLLLTLSAIIGLVDPLFEVFGQEVSGRDLILLIGGLFLIGKSTYEIHDKLEGHEGHASAKAAASFASVIIQIGLLDIVFSLDSVITAVGMVDEIGVMIAAVVIAIGVMLVAAEAVSAFVDRHPTVKILALSFLLLIGLSLILEGLHRHIPKGYIYFAMGFSLFVESINLRAGRKRAEKAAAIADDPVQLKKRYSKKRPGPQASGKAPAKTAARPKTLARPKAKPTGRR